jgi:hypothetical protein
VHGETTVPYGGAIFPFPYHRRAQVLRAPWPGHLGMAMHFLSVVLVALYTREARRGSRWTNSGASPFPVQIGPTGLV